MFTFSRAIAAHTNSSNPCTNTLEFCTACPLEPVPTVHFTYSGGDVENPKGMLHHWRTKHSGDPHANLQKATTISDAERDGVMAVGKTPPKPRKKKGAGVAADNSKKEKKPKAAAGKKKRKASESSSSEDDIDSDDSSGHSNDPDDVDDRPPLESLLESGDSDDSVESGCDDSKEDDEE